MLHVYKTYPVILLLCGSLCKYSTMCVLLLPFSSLTSKSLCVFQHSRWHLNSLNRSAHFHSFVFVPTVTLPIMPSLMPPHSQRPCSMRQIMAFQSFKLNQLLEQQNSAQALGEEEHSPNCKKYQTIHWCVQMYSVFYISTQTGRKKITLYIRLS